MLRKEREKGKKYFVAVKIKLKASKETMNFNIIRKFKFLEQNALKILKSVTNKNKRKAQMKFNNAQ